MKVNDLVKVLSKLDPEAECAIFIKSTTYMYEVVGAHLIESDPDEVEIVSIDVKE